MAKNSRAHREDAWRNAKTICRLSRRQVEMARRLGLNPKKLPGLRPSPQQRRKLPVGAFIEECYRKRFGEETAGADPHAPDSGSSRASHPPEQARASARLEPPREQLTNLVCYLLNLADDLGGWIAHGTVDRDLTAQVGEELREIAQALHTGAPVSPMPEIPPPPDAGRLSSQRKGDPEPPFDDDDIPF
jgi:hypothetical protein